MEFQSRRDKCPLPYTQRGLFAYAVSTDSMPVSVAEEVSAKRH